MFILVVSTVNICCLLALGIYVVHVIPSVEISKLEGTPPPPELSIANLAISVGFDVSASSLI